MTIVQSGIDVARFASGSPDEALLASWHLDRDAFIIGTVAAFEEAKGYLVLLDAVRHVVDRHRQCRFVWLGTGGDAEWLREAAERRGLEGEIVISRISSPLETALPLMHLFVLPSLSEGLSTALLAALAAGLPVVASDTGGIPEVIGSGCGVLVPPGDAEELAGSVIALTEDEGWRRELSIRGRERALRFDIGRTVEATLDVYRAVLGGKRVGHG